MPILTSSPKVCIANFSSSFDGPRTDFGSLTRICGQPLQQAVNPAVLIVMSTSTQTLTGPALLERARAFATRKHDGQKGKRPGETYLDHLETVVRLLKEHGEGRDEVLAAAYLHDCLEKTDTDVAELICEFGEDIAEQVYWLTDPGDSEGPEKELLSAWLLARAPIEAKLIKLADIADNVDAIRQNDPARWPRFRESKGRILDRMAAVEGKGFERLTLFMQARAALASIS